MQGRTSGRAAGKDEVTKRRHLCLERIDPVLQPRDACVIDDDLGYTRRDLVRRIGEACSQRKQVALEPDDDLGELAVGAVRGGNAYGRLHFVHVAIGRHPGVGLADACAIEQARVATVAGFCVDFHCPDYMYSPSAAERQRFRRQLLAWYRKHGRDLPWRKTDNPYHILVSEIMLQQTQVDRVLPKYHEWLERYPSFEALATAPPREVKRAWYPLGYNIRPTRLQSIAREAVARFDGRLPADEATLLSFKGIGRYTAGAIRSFAFRERAAILDTNVARVLARVFLGGRDPKQHSTRRLLWTLSEILVPRRHCFDFNQALMDFGATVCVARKPRCAVCPMRRHCRAFALQHSR